LTEPSVDSGRLVNIADKLDKASLVMLYGCALAAPHSIAGSQGSFLAAVLFWLIACILRRKFKVLPTPLDLPLLGLFGWAVLSACFSYERAQSFNGLKQLAFLGLFYFASTRAYEGRHAKRLALILIFSCLINVGYTFFQKIAGQGLRIDKISEDSKLNRASAGIIIFVQGDVLLSVDDKPLKSLQQFSDAIDNGPPRSTVKVNFRHGELLLTTFVDRRRIQKATDLVGTARFGIEVSPARDFRAQGFYNHYTTYAEVLQLITSLIFGFLLVSPRNWKYILGFTTLGILFTSALIFTATRGPLAALAFSVLAMILVLQDQRKFRKIILIGLIIVALPVGIYLTSKWRGVGFFDMKDGSTTWRLEMWQEGIKLIAKHPIFGIGKGSERDHWAEWGLFQNGKLPPGHFHSTPMQIAVWWGIPALLIYLSFMAKALYMLVQFIKLKSDEIDWQQRALVLGVFGGLVGFNVSSFVHFNFGDGEVIMVLWLVLGLAMAEIFLVKKHL
jgi:O-antigen ligase